MAAPSIHPSGAPYAWDGAEPIHKQVILPAPGWLLMEMEAERNGNAGSLNRSPRSIKKGAQHSTLFRLGAAMRAKGCEEPEVFAAVWEVNQHRCEVPGPRENIEKLAASICMQYAAGSTVKSARSPPPRDEDAPPIGAKHTRRRTA